MLLGMLSLSIAVAQVSQPLPPALGGPDPRQQDTDLLLGIHGVAEVWSDAAIASVYRSSAFSGSVSATWQFHRFLAADLELAYFRTVGEDNQRIEMTPIALDLSLWKSLGNIEIFGGAGPALVPWSDQGTDFRTGTKLGMDARIGVRVGTTLYDPPDYPPSPMERVDLEIYVGRRTHLGPTTNILVPGEAGSGAGRLDLSAARAGVGFKVRL